MTNHNPTITSSAATGSFSENANTTGSNALHNLSGTMNFTDSDRNDTHTTSASLKSAVLSSGSIIPSGSLSRFNTAMSSIVQSDSNGSGKIKWSFGAEDDDFDFLSKNQSLTLTYEIKVNDNHGGTTKKTVTITITGTDDKPIIDFGTHAVVSERANQTLSFANDTANIAVHFTDVDLTNTGHTATVIDADVSGDTYGLLASESLLMSFYDINSVVKTSGSSNGTINTTFSAPDLLFDYLGVGDSIDIKYTIRLDDHAGGITNQTVIVTVVGTNDKPIYLSGPDTSHLVEGQNVSPAGDLTACGDFLFADIDLSDGHTVTTTATATRSGGGPVPLTNAQLLAALSTDVDPDSTNHLLGEVDWSFALDNDDVAFLNSGETLTITYTLTLTDDAGGTDTQTVTVKILGTNDPVIVTSGPQAASLAEFADTTGSGSPNTTTPVPTGSIAFIDTDLGDTHTVAVLVVDAVWSGGPAVPSGTQADLPSALLTALNDSTGTGTGSVDWSFSIPDFDLDFLAAGETLTVTYDVTVSDGPTSDSQTVTITVDGANDAVVMTGGPGSASITEFADTTGSTDPNATSPVPTGTLTFADVDLNDTHTVSVAVASTVWSTGSSTPGATDGQLMSALMTALNDSTGSGNGGVDWSFSIEDQYLDFLGAGETLTVTYDVTVQDGATSSTQQVVITITGTADDAVVNSLTAPLSDTAAPDTGQIVAAGNLIEDAGSTGGDNSNSLTVTDVNGQPLVGGTVEVVGTYGTLTVSSDGGYSYTANANLDPLQVGDDTTEVFTFTVTDGSAQTYPATVTFNVTGADDAPVITGADAFASLTEDAGPTVMVNGSFESGDFTGWLPSGDVTAEFTGLGGALGNYSARITTNGSLTQNVATVAGQTYTLSFYVAGDPEATSNSFAVFWDGVPVVIESDSFGGITRYTVAVVGNASNPTTQLVIAAGTDGTGLLIDQVAVEATPGPVSQSRDGSVSFADVEIADTHTANFAPQGVDYVGTFTLDPVSEASGSGSVGWHFTVDNADIQFLGEGDALTQTYTIVITDDFGASVTQDVAVTINGANDAPTAGARTIITNADDGENVLIPGWALALNASDPDLGDTHNLAGVEGSTGGSAFQLGTDAYFVEDAVPGGTFDYRVTDGIATSANTGTATIVNLSSLATTLTGTGGDDILVALNGGETLIGGGGDDILIGNSGAHVLTGGTGDDIFAFQVIPNALNTITDFDAVGGDDMIAVSAAAFGSGLTAGMDSSQVFESTSDAEFLGSLFHYDTSSQILYFSADGTTGSATVVAQLQPGVLLGAQDLLIV